MLTTEGKNHIKRYLAGWNPAIAQSIAMGIGTAAESVGDVALQFQVAQSQINVTNYDFANNKLVYKAPIPEDFVGTIYEIGIYSLVDDPNGSEYGSRNLTTFDSATETWINTANEALATFASTSNRVGVDSLRAQPAASATLTVALRELELNLSGYSAADSFTFAFNVGNSFTSKVLYRFMTDASNYYTFDLGAQTTGYKFVERAKSTATVTGTPNWGNITEIQVATTSTSGGASDVSYDAIRIEDKDAVDLDYVLVARKVLSTPVTKVEGMAQDIEFSLDVSTL